MSAFGQVVRNEARLVRRQPTNMIGSIGLPVVLMIIFGELPSFHQHISALGGLPLFDTYVPIIMVLGLTMLTLLGLPSPLVSYRELGILRRLSTTPVPPSWLLAAQVVVQLCIALAGLAIVNIASVAAFGAPVPKSPGGLALSCLLAIGGLFALGLLIAALAPTANSVNAIGRLALIPLLFFAGLWLPRPLMPAVLLDISNYTPLGAAVQAIQGSVQTGFPPAAPLLVLAGYTLVFAYLARRFFRWELGRELRAGAAPAQVVTPGPGRLRVSQQPTWRGHSVHPGPGLSSLTELGRGAAAYVRQARTACTSSPARLSARSCRMWLTT